LGQKLGAANLRKIAAGIEKLAKEGASPSTLLSLTDALAHEFAELSKLLMVFPFKNLRRDSISQRTLADPFSWLACGHLLNNEYVRP
jgi:hypothetical protein